MLHLLLLSKYLVYPIIWGSFMRHGLIPPLLLHPIKSLKEPFLTYESLSDIAILLISSLFMLIGCLCLSWWNVFWLMSSSLKINFFHPFFIQNKKEYIDFVYFAIVFWLIFFRHISISISFFSISILIFIVFFVR